MFILDNFTIVLLKCFRGEGKKELEEFCLILGTMSKGNIKIINCLFGIDITQSEIMSGQLECKAV